MRPDMLGEWLPLALADILSAWCGAKRPEILRGWGLDALADEAEGAEMSAFLRMIGKDANLNVTRTENVIEGVIDGKDGVRDAVEQRGDGKPDGSAPPAEGEEPKGRENDRDAVSGA